MEAGDETKLFKCATSDVDAIITQTDDTTMSWSKIEFLAAFFQGQEVKENYKS